MSGYRHRFFMRRLFQTTRRCKNVTAVFVPRRPPCRHIIVRTFVHSTTTRFEQYKQEKQQQHGNGNADEKTKTSTDDHNGNIPPRIDKDDDQISTAAATTTNVYTNAGVFKQLQSPPNIISLCRIASAPLLSYWIIVDSQYFNQYALIGCCVAAASDYLDGYLAKRYNMSTTLGTYLDPLGDKVMINVLSVSLAYVHVLPVPLVVLWMVKDIGLMAGGMYYVQQQQQQQQSTTVEKIKESLKKTLTEEPGKYTIPNTYAIPKNSNNVYNSDKNLPFFVPQQLKVNPTFISKVNTALQFLTLGVGIVHPLHAMPVLLKGLCCTTAGTTIASGLSYVGYSAFSKVGKQ